MSLQLKVSRAAAMGDPGLGSFLKGIAGKVAKVAAPVASMLTGGTVGAAIGAVSTIAGRGGSRPQLVQPPGPPPMIVPVTRSPGIGGALARAIPGGQTGYEAAVPQGGPPPSGYHWNKSSYFLRSGEFVPKGTRLVKNRRRNALNPRALDRAVSRVISAKKAARMLSDVRFHGKLADRC